MATCARESVTISVSVDHRAAYTSSRCGRPRRRRQARRRSGEEGLERVEEGHAALVEHGLLDQLVRSHQNGWRDRQPETLGRFYIDDQVETDGVLPWRAG